VAPLKPIDSSPLWHPYTAVPSERPRKLMVRAEGAYIYDAEGKKYFDATSSWWCNLHGHCHPDLVKALSSQAAQLDQILFAPHAHPVAIEFSELLLSKLGHPFEKLFFSDDGSTAVEAALKMALQYWSNRGEKDRTEFLSLELGYHGDTLGAVSVGHLDEFHRFFPSVLTTHKSTAPYCYRCPLNLQFPQCETACLTKAEKILSERGSRIAALIVEPLVLGAGGLITYPAAYLDKLMRLCRSQGVLVIFDEVFTGFGRTGTLFAKDQCSEAPDFVCLSKGLTSGMLPMGVTATTRAVFDAFTGSESRKFYHGHTFTANALGCAVALESLKLIERNRVLEKIAALQPFFVEQAKRFRALEHVGDVRHLGMIWAMELVQDRTTKTTPSPANGPGWKICDAMLNRGFWLRPMGSALYVIPPYCSTEEDLRQCFDVLYGEVSNKAHF
jgi:adenosylmethionine-8-amino-7-oxononanoate transaminase